MATSLTSWRPFAEIEDLRRRFDRMLEDTSSGHRFDMAVDLVEEDDRYVKGVTADEVEASCHDGVLEVTFPKAKEKERKTVTITPKTV